MLDSARCFISIDVEEWFASTKLINVPLEHSYRLQSDIEETSVWILNKLEETGLKATFFFVLEIADHYPLLVKRIINEGHEIALHGETHDHLSTFSIHEFESMLARMKEYFFRSFHITLRGYRAPYFSIHPAAISALKRQQFIYDSSVVPSLPIPGWYGVHSAPLTPYFIGTSCLGERDPNGTFIEFPMSVHPSFRLPGIGGFYLRNLGLSWAKLLLKVCIRKLGYAVIYLHPWELSTSLAKLSALPFSMRRRTGDWTKNAFEALLLQMRKYEINSTTMAEAAKALVSNRGLF